jgi:probable rRNA maturation factor
MGMMIECKTAEAPARADEGDSASDDEPGPSPAAVLVSHDAWDGFPLAVQRVHEAVNATVRRAPRLGAGHISVALASDGEIRQLNARFRGQDKATNVLSFPSAPTPGLADHDASGDIVIAYETTIREAAEEGKDPAHHLAHLTVHGLLHLAGYDHGEEAAAERMEALERLILADLGIPDPYRSDSEEDRPQQTAATRQRP